MTTSRDVVRGLGLRAGEEQVVEQVVRREVATAQNTLQLKKSLMATLLRAPFRPEVRSLLTRRAVRLYEGQLQKSGHPEVYSPDEAAELMGLRKAEPRGGKYYRRVSKGGRHRYYYSRDDYERSQSDHHTGGEENQKAYLKSAVTRRVCKTGGCDVSELKPLVKRYGAAAVHDAARSAVQDGHVTFAKGRFSPAKQQSAKKKPPEQSAEPKALLRKGQPDCVFVVRADLLSKAFPVGTVRTWRNGRYQKQANGRWSPIGTEGHAGLGHAPRTGQPGTERYARMPWRSQPPPGMLAGQLEGEPGQRGGTEQMHWDPEKGTYRPERMQLHAQIVSGAFEGKKPGQKTAIVMMGGTASGKSTMLRNSGAAEGADYIHVDADDIKDQLPEYGEAKRLKYRGAAGLAHEESSHLAKEIATKAISEGYPVVLDGTGANEKKFRRQIDQLKAAGYHVHLMMPDQDAAKAKRDAVKRANRTGRYVPPAFIQHAYDRIPQNFFKMAALADTAALYDRRQQSKLVWQKGPDGTEQAHDEAFLKNYPGYKGAGS